MSQSISPISAPAWDKQTFGASVVTGTLDAMNNRNTSSAAPTDKASFGAAVVSGTLDAMNSPSPGASSSADMSSTYNFSQSVLESAYTGRGTIVDSWA